MLTVDGRAKLPGSDSAEVVNATEVHGEVSLQRQVVDVGSELEGVLALGEREVVGELVALLRAAHKTERFASEERNAGHVHSDVAAIRRAREVVAQRTPGIVELEFVHLVGAESPGVLRADVVIVKILRRSARVGVLAEVLRALRVHLDAVNLARTESDAEVEILIGVEPMIEPQRERRWCLRRPENCRSGCSCATIEAGSGAPMWGRRSGRACCQSSRR